MKTSEAIEHFKSQSGVARALGMKPSSVCTWGEYPPVLRQLQLEAMTGGSLKAEPECDKFRAPALAA